MRGRSNLNWVQISDFDAYRPEVLRDCAPAGVRRPHGQRVLRLEAGVRVDDTFSVPAAVDWVGFDEYCVSHEALDARMTKLVERAPDKELFLIPEAAPQSWRADRTDADLESTQCLYLALARQHPAFAGIMVFGPWTGVGPAATGPGTPVPSKFPRTTEAQERVAALVLGDARLLG